MKRDNEADLNATSPSSFEKLRSKRGRKKPTPTIKGRVDTHEIKWSKKC